MKKPIISALCALMTFSSAYAAQITPEIVKNGGAGIDVTRSEITENGDETVNAEFYGSDEEKRSFDIGIDIFNSLGTKIYGYETTGILSNLSNLPIKFSVTGASDASSVRLTAKAADPIKEIAVADSGDDSNSGSASSPVRTLAKAVSLAKTAAQSGEYKRAEIILYGGKYDFSETLNLSYNEAVPLVIKTNGENVCFGSGITVRGTDFRTLSDSEKTMFPETAKNNIYALNLSDYGYTANFSGEKDDNSPIYISMYDGNEKMMLAGYPKNGFSDTAQSIWTLQNGSASLTYYDFSFKASDVGAWKYYNNAWVSGYFMEEWALASGAVQSISNDTVKVEKYLSGHFNSASFLKNNNKTGNKWRIYNLPDVLSEAGEYVIYDNTLYYFPKNKDSFSESKILINTNTKAMLNLTHSKNIKIEGITFECSQGYYIKSDSGANNLEIAGCVFKDNTKDAVSLNGNNIKVNSCDFYDIDGCPLIISGGNRNTLTPSGNVVENCDFHNINAISRTNTGAIGINGCGVTVRKNKFSDIPHSVIRYSGNNHIIEYNELTNCDTDRIGDAGYIHNGNDMSNLGTVIRKNYFHDGYSAMGAIYYDDRLSGQTAENNVFENLTGSALFIHGGVNNKFNGNIVINTTNGARVRDKDLYITANVRKIVAGETVINSQQVNCWDSKLLTGEDGEKLVNLGDNLFMLRLVGGPANGITYPSYPYKSSVWQSAYGDTLKYLNNKTTRKAEDIEVKNNTFVNVEKYTIWTLKDQWTGNGMELSDLILSGNTENLTSLPESARELYNDVKDNSGLYQNSYRKK